MPKTTLQVPPELDERIQVIADRERRSKHQQMLTMLEAAVKANEFEALAAEIERVIGGYPGNEATRPKVGVGEHLNDAQWAAKIIREWPARAQKMRISPPRPPAG